MVVSRIVLVQPIRLGAGHRLTLCRGKEVMKLIKLVSVAGYCGSRYAAEEYRLTGISNSVGYILIFSIVILMSSEVNADNQASTVPTQINLWYGNYQTFGANGVPQQWVNILGNVTSAGGTMLTYSLNGAPEVNLNWAPTHPRLVIAMLRYCLNSAPKVNLD